MLARFAVLVVCCLLANLPSQAQTRAYVLQPVAGSSPASLVEIDVESGSTVRSSAVPGVGSFVSQGQPLGITADGRFVAWLGNELYPAKTLSVLDRHTAVATVLASAPPGSGIFADGYPHTLLAHPTEIRVFAVAADTLLSIDATGYRVIPAALPLRDVLSISRDGRILLIEHDAFSVERFDTRTGASLGRINSQNGFWTMSPNGDAVYSQVYTGGGLYVVRRHDPVTGIVVSQRAWPTTTGMVASVATHPVTGHVLVGLFAGRYDVLDPISLERLGAITSTLPGPPTHGGVYSTLAFDPYQRRAYLLAYRDQYNPPGPIESMVDIFDVDTLTRVGGFSAPTDARIMAIVPRPPAPANLSAVVVGARVTLSWSAGPGPGAVSEYRVEAGSGPGLSNIATLVTGNTPGLIVDNVPAGTYYVRIRGASTDTVTSASNEVVVTVP